MTKRSSGAARAETALPGLEHSSDPDESEAERLKRNWADILQELRVIQTGTQIIAGFLLAAAFQSRFAELQPGERLVYLGLLVAAITTTVLGLTPVVLHRVLFRQGAKARLVRLGNRLLVATLIGVAVTLSGIALLVFELVAGWTVALIAVAACTLVFGLLWVLLPWRARVQRDRDERAAEAAADRGGARD